MQNVNLWKYQAIWDLETHQALFSFQLTDPSSRGQMTQTYIIWTIMPRKLLILRCTEDNFYLVSKRLHLF